MKASALLGFPLGIGLLALVSTCVVFGVLNLVVRWFIWLPPEKRVPATLPEFAQMIGICTAVVIGLYYLGWLAFFVFVPDIREAIGHLGRNGRSTVEDGCPD
ncbi:MAG: hypothetical protein AAGK09_00060 [Planctomycetota bacterium]